MKNLKIILLIVSLVILSSCSKKDEKVNTENQSSTQNVAPNSNQVTTNPADVKKWIGKYQFDESAKSVNGVSSQSWGYMIDVTGVNDSTLAATIQVDGFQTMTRIEADVKATDKTADFIFSKYGKDNMFEIYKKGERLFSFQLNGNNEIITNWDKMKANVIENQKSGKVMFKRVTS